MTILEKNYGELGKREVSVRFGIVRSTDDVNQLMKIEMCDSPGTIVDVYYQNMVQPIISSGTTSIEGWGIYSIPVADIGSIAVMIFHKNQFPLVLGYMAADYRTGVNRGTLEKISSGEIMVKCSQKSQIYFDNTGNINIKCFHELHYTGYPTPSSTTADITIAIKKGKIIINEADVANLKYVARVGDTVAADSTFWTWLKAVGTATAVGDPPSQTIAVINSGTDKIQVD